MQDSSSKELFYDTSSLRYNENLRYDIDASGVYDLKPVVYDRKDGSKVDEVGLIAEEVYEVFPGIVSKNEKGEIESYCKEDLVPYLVNVSKI